MSFTLNFHFIYLKNHNISVFSITNSLSVRLNFSKHNSEIRYSILMGTIWPWQISPINMQPTSALNNYAGLAAVLQLVLQLVSWTSWQHQAVHRGGSRYIGPTLMSSTKSWYEAVPSSVWTSCWTHISVVSGYYGLVVAWCWRYRSYCGISDKEKQRRTIITRQYKKNSTHTRYVKTTDKILLNY